jgi:hypothetical protein
MTSDAIPETALVGLFDRLNRTTRRHWADLGILRKAPRGEGYNEEDAAQLAAFVRLIQADIGDFHETVAAWKGIQEALKAAMSDERAEISAELIAVIDGDTKQGMLITREDELGSLLLRDTRKKRVFRVVDLSDEVRVAREAFQRIVAARNLGSKRS